jgi:hypothetical protein
MNKRKAMIGWLVYTAAKPLVRQFVKRKTKSAVPASPGRSKSRLAAMVAAGAAIGGALFFWRRKSDEGGPPPVTGS